MSRRENNLTETDISALHDFANSPDFTNLEKAVLQYATEMTSTPVRIDEDNFVTLKREFSSTQLVELTATIAHENFRARYNHAFGIESAEFDSAELGSSEPAFSESSSAEQTHRS